MIWILALSLSYVGPFTLLIFYDLLLLFYFDLVNSIVLSSSSLFLSFIISTLLLSPSSKFYFFFISFLSFFFFFAFFNPGTSIWFSFITWCLTEMFYLFINFKLIDCCSLKHFYNGCFKNSQIVLTFDSLQCWHLLMTFFHLSCDFPGLWWVIFLLYHV